MKKVMMGCLMLAALLSCESRKENKTLTLMSYNVGVFSKYQENSMPGIAQLIRETGATLVGMSEVDSCNTRHNAYQAKDLAKMLDWDFLFSRAIPYRGGAYGDAIVSEKPVVASYRVPLSQAGGAEARSLAVVETEDCVFGATHLDHRSNEAALVQMKEVNEWFAAHYAGSKKPVFLCGDLNVYPESEVIALAETSWTLLSGVDFTFPSRNPRACIDYIFAFKNAAPVEVLSHHVITEGTSDLSDHLPVVVKVKL